MCQHSQKGPERKKKKHPTELANKKTTTTFAKTHIALVNIQTLVPCRPFVHHQKRWSWIHPAKVRQFGEEIRRLTSLSTAYIYIYRYIGKNKYIYISTYKYVYIYMYPRHPVIFSDNEQGMFNHRRIVFGFHYHSQEVIGSVGIYIKKNICK